ncbi:MAG: TonB-dependent receptor, partial ['Waltheria sp.' little leaf phytoplasma]|nr:TonB-dependent receptor ['Waltheria sp.' little leaf phytoplasma]
KTIGDLLQAVNGVTLLSNGGTVSKPVIHGLHSNRILMVNNGIRQEDQQWGSEHAPNIDPFLASRITVIKGAAGVRYGTDAIGGVVLVEPAPLRTSGWGGEVNLAGFSNNRMGVAEAMIEHGLKQVPGLAFRLQGTLKQGGNYRIPGYYVANTGVKESDYSAAIAYRRPHQSIELFYSHFNTDLGIYRGSHTGSKDDLLQAIKSDTPLVSAGFTYNIGRPRQHVAHDLAKLKLNAENQLGKWSLVYAFQHNFRQEYDVMRKDDGKAQLNLTLNTQTLNLNLDHVTWKGLTGEIGVDGIFQTNRFPAGDRLFIPWYNTAGGGLYLIERWKRNSWTVEGGLRYDYRWYNVWNNEGNNQAVVEYQYAYNSLSGTLGVSKAVTSRLNLSATLSNAWRAPQANELFSAGLHQEAARIELGNKDLLPERSYGLNLEGKWQATPKLSAELSLYSQYIRNYIYLEPGADLLTIRGYFKTFHYRQTNAWLKVYLLGKTIK